MFILIRLRAEMIRDTVLRSAGGDFPVLFILPIFSSFGLLLVSFMNVPYECFISKGEKSFIVYSINWIKNHFKNVAWISNNKKTT
jgi:hypothetical protein